jgi:hypothetical protein
MVTKVAANGAGWHHSVHMTWREMVGGVLDTLW